MCFYDAFRRQTYEIDYDIYGKFMNINYEKYCKNVAFVDAGMIEWFNSTYTTTDLCHYRMIMSAILNNNITTVEKLYKIRPIDIKREFRVGNGTFIFS